MYHIWYPIGRLVEAPAPLIPTRPSLLSRLRCDLQRERVYGALPKRFPATRPLLTPAATLTAAQLDFVSTSTVYPRGPRIAVLLACLFEARQNVHR